MPGLRCPACNGEMQIRDTIGKEGYQVRYRRCKSARCFGRVQTYEVTGETLHKFFTDPDSEDPSVKALRKALHSANDAWLKRRKQAVALMGRRAE